MAPQSSLLKQFVDAIGSGQLIMLVVVCLSCLLALVLVMIRGRGPHAIAALLLIPPLPLFIAAPTIVYGLMSSYHIAAHSLYEPKLTEALTGMNQALATAWLALKLTSVLMIVALVGGGVRWITKQDKVALTDSPFRS